MRDNKKKTHPSDEPSPVLIDGSGPCKFTRCYYADEPAILIHSPDMSRPILITGPVLSGINGWIARLMVHEAKDTLN